MSVGNEIQRVIEPLKSKGYNLLIQDWNDGFLLHVYSREGQKHETTVGAETLEKAVEKGLKFHEEKHKKDEIQVYGGFCKTCGHKDCLCNRTLGYFK